MARKKRTWSTAVTRAPAQSFPIENQPNREIRAPPKRTKQNINPNQALRPTKKPNRSKRSKHQTSPPNPTDPKKRTGDQTQPGPKLSQHRPKPRKNCKDDARCRGAAQQDPVDPLQPRDYLRRPRTRRATLHKHNTLKIQRPKR